MPWFPDFVAAMELARRETRAAGVVFRRYCSQRPVVGRRPVRAPILDAGPVRPGDVVGRYQAALGAGDTDAIVDTFAPSGYVREPIGPFHRRTDELRSSARVYDDVETPVERA